MPIRPENRARQAHWGASEADFLLPEELDAIATLRRSGFDPLAQPQFWEVMVARIVGGEVTAHKAEHDVTVEMLGRDRHVEVKFASGHVGHFSPIRSKPYDREVFRWAKPRGCGGKASVDAIVLIGRAMSGLVYSWVVPREAVAPRTPSICVTCPEARASDGWRWDRFAVPLDQLAPAIKRALHWTPQPIEPPGAMLRRRVLAKAGQIAFELECSTGRRVLR